MACYSRIAITSRHKQITLRIYCANYLEKKTTKYRQTANMHYTCHVSMHAVTQYVVYTYSLI